MCDIFNDYGLITKSKNEFLEMKKNIETHLTKENIEKLDDNTVKSFQSMLNFIDEKLETWVNGGLMRRNNYFVFYKYP